MRRLKINAWLSVMAVLLIVSAVSAHNEVDADTKSDSVSFEASFAGSQLDLTQRWYLEGQGKAQIDSGSLALQDTGKGLVLWTRQDFPSDVGLQFDLSFSNNRGIGVFFIAARGLKGEDILKDLPKRTGKYGQYTKGKINNYGFSLHRFYPDGRHNPGTNFRKNGSFHLLHHVEPDPVMKANQTYHVRIEKIGGHLRLWTDGILIHDHKDDGTNGAILQGGKIGFRVRGHPSSVMYLDNIVINSL